MMTHCRPCRRNLRSASSGHILSTRQRKSTGMVKWCAEREAIPRPMCVGQAKDLANTFSRPTNTKMSCPTAFSTLHGTTSAYQHHTSLTPRHINTQRGERIKMANITADFLPPSVDRDFCAQNFPAWRVPCGRSSSLPIVSTATTF